jgi:hypothetical protein
MLGPYGANLLLATGASRVRELAVVRRNLRRLLGDHPDVSALDVRAGETVSTLRVPPMLRASWDALVAATAEHPELITADSLPGNIANHMFGTGVWLTWEATRARSAKPTERAKDTNIAGGIDEFADVRVAEQSASRKKRRKQAAPLSPVSEGVVAIATKRAREKPLWTCDDETLQRARPRPNARCAQRSRCDSPLRSVRHIGLTSTRTRVRKWMIRKWMHPLYRCRAGSGSSS